LKNERERKTKDSPQKYTKISECDATELVTTNKMTRLLKFVNIHPMRARLGVAYVNCGNERTALYTKIPHNSSAICKIKLSFVRNFLTPFRYAFYE
jgi:hypothetical protein